MNTIEHLKLYGFAVEENVIPKEECKKMADILDDIESERRKTNKIDYSTNAQVVINNLHLIRPDLFLDKISLPNIMSVASAILGDDFILNGANASRSGSEGGNNPHTDSRIPVRDFDKTLGIFVTLCLDDYTVNNGAMLISPFSHTLGEKESVVRSQKNILGKMPCTAQRGSLIYCLSQTLHDVGKNLDGKRRWGLILSYNRWWIKPFYNFTRCGKEIFDKLTPQQKILFGFTTTPPHFKSTRYYTRMRIEDLPTDYEEALNI